METHPAHPTADGVPGGAGGTTEPRPAALQALVQRERPRLLRLAAGIAGQDDAEDVLQDSFVSAYLGLPALEKDASMPAWLRQIVANTARSALRRQARRAVSLDAMGETDTAAHGEVQRPGPLDAVLDQARSENFKRAVGQLTEAQRVTIRMRYYEELSVDEIAAKLGISTKAVYKRLEDGHAALRRALRGGGEMPKLTCRLLRRRLALYGMGTLAPRRAAPVERHLEKCERCGERLRQIVREEVLLHRTFQAAGASVFGVEDAGTKCGCTPSARRRTSRMPWAVVAAAVLVVLVLGAALLIHCRTSGCGGTPGTPCTCAPGCPCPASVDAGVGWCDTNGKLLGDVRACVCRERGLRPALVLGAGSVAGESIEPTAYASLSHSGMRLGKAHVSVQAGVARLWRSADLRPFGGVSAAPFPGWSVGVHYDGQYTYPSLWRRQEGMSFGVILIRPGRPGVAFSIQS